MRDASETTHGPLRRAGARRCGAALAAVALALGCSRDPGARPPPEPAPAGAPVDVTELDIGDDITGLSGLTVDEHGVLFSVAERAAALVAVRRGERAARVIPIDGVPEGLELESVAYLGDSRFAIGTEGRCDRNTSRVLLVTAGPEHVRAHVTGTIDVPHDLWSATCKKNYGIEGLCHAAGALVAAIEQPVRGPDGQRLAPIAHIDLASGRVTPFLAPLTSDTGKLSGLDCPDRHGDSHGDGHAGTIDVWGIERHFETSRLVRFSVPSRPDAATSAPQRLHTDVMANLRPYTQNGTRNLEGLVRMDRDVILIVDNHWRTVTGPNELLWIGPMAGITP